MREVNGRFISDKVGELGQQEAMENFADLLTELSNALSTTVDGDALALTTMSVSGLATLVGGASAGAALYPTTSDGAALGSASKMWSDAFLASGAVINFNAGDATITHSTGLLTFNTSVTTAGLTTTGGAVLINSAHADLDTIIHGDTQNLLFCNAGTNRVGILCDPSYPLHVSSAGIDILETGNDRYQVNIGDGTRYLALGVDNTSVISYLLCGGSSGSLKIMTHNGSAWGARLTIDATGNVDCSAQMKTGANVGAKNGTGVAVVEYGDGTIHQTVITCTAHSVSIDGTAIGFGASKLYDFPAGQIIILGAVANLTVTRVGTAIGADFDGDFAVGSTATVDSTIDGTDVNVIASTATPQATAGATTAKGASAGVVILNAAGTDDADLNLNVLVDDADITGNDAVTIGGTLTVTWIKGGDY